VRILTKQPLLGVFAVPRLFMGAQDPSSHNGPNGYSSKTNVDFPDKVWFGKVPLEI
jgi:hypothetical protein